MTMVSGDEAKKCNACRRDTMMPAHPPGTLLIADDMLGLIKWQDRDKTKEVTLGQGAIWIELRKR